MVINILNLSRKDELLYIWNMHRFCALIACVLSIVCATGQTTVCLIKEDSVCAGSTDRSCIKSVLNFNFIYAGPIDTSVVNAITRIAADCRDFKTLSNSCVLKLKALYADYFSGILRNNPDYFDRQAVDGQASSSIGQISFFGFEDNKPVLLTGAFYVNKGVRHPVAISYSMEQRSLAVLSVGYHTRHKGIVGKLEDGGAVIEIKKLIGYETNDLVDGGGPPIDVLVVTTKGNIWIRK
jgi:hypothetical protein